jgi:hypothetical protein
LRLRPDGAGYRLCAYDWELATIGDLLRNPDEAYDLNRMDEYSLGDSGGIFYQKFLRKPVKEMTDEEIMILRPKVQEMHTRSSPDNVFVKTHNALVQFRDKPLIHMDWTAGAIYIAAAIWLFVRLMDSAERRALKLHRSVPVAIVSP